MDTEHDHPVVRRHTGVDRLRKGERVQFRAVHVEVAHVDRLDAPGLQPGALRCRVDARGGRHMEAFGRVERLLVVDGAKAARLPILTSFARGFASIAARPPVTPFARSPSPNFGGCGNQAGSVQIQLGSPVPRSRTGRQDSGCPPLPPRLGGLLPGRTRASSEVFSSEDAGPTFPTVEVCGGQACPGTEVPGGGRVLHPGMSRAARGGARAEDRCVPANPRHHGA